jgi:flagellar assembly factor FliW
VIINLDRRIGRQVIVSDEQPLQMRLPAPAVPLRKSA